MLVLNRRPGESIVIEPDVRVTVLSVANRRVWVGLDTGRAGDAVNLCATSASATEGRLEIGPVRGVDFDADHVRVAAGGQDHPSVRAHATLAVTLPLGRRVEVGEALWVAIVSTSKGNVTLRLGGEAVGEELGVTLIRPTGSYVRVGVDAPGRRVYRHELWEAVQRGVAGNGATASRDGATASRNAAPPSADGAPPSADGAPPSADGAPTSYDGELGLVSAPPPRAARAASTAQQG